MQACRPAPARRPARTTYIRGQALLTRHMGVGGVLGPERDVREFPTDNADMASLAVDAAGNAQVVWRNVSAVSGHSIQTRRELPDGSLGPVQTLGQYSGLSPEPQVALDAHGAAHHVWLTEAGSKTVVMARSRASDGSLGPIQQLSASSSGSGGNAAYPAVAGGPNGRPVAARTRTTDAGPELVQGAVLAPEPSAGGGGTVGGGTSPGAAGGGTGTGPTAEPDRLAPKLSGLAVKPARPVVRKRGRVRYTLSEASTVVLRIVRRGATRRVVGRLRTTGVAGANRLTFRSRLRGRYLRPGRYQLVAAATDQAGNRSAPSRARFRVIRR